MQNIKKTKIVSSIGPVTDTTPIMARLLKAGVNIARLNFSHGNHEEHQMRIDNLRKASQMTGIPVAVLQDLGGPKIRTGDFENGEVHIKKGQSFILSAKKQAGTSEKCFLSYTDLWKEVQVGQIIYLDDGKKALKVTSTKPGEVHTKVLAGGIMKSRRGVNIPGVRLKNVTALTPKDKKDLEFGVKNQVDFFALSFVQDATDIKQLRTLLKRKNCSAKIIAKIETASAIEHIDEIIAEANGIMVARGDLAVEVPAEDVPLLQKDIISRCNKVGKPVIVATQMLQSMVSTPRPSRAEVSDVANSILDGADAIMLSDETTIGEYPTEAVSMMSSIATKMEQTLARRIFPTHAKREEIDNAVSRTTVELAEEVNARVIVALTETGRTARLVSRFRPKQPIIVLSPHDETCRQALLSYDCYPYHIKPFTELKEATQKVRDLLLKEKLARKDDIFVLVAGIPFGHSGATNMVLVERV